MPHSNDDYESATLLGGGDTDNLKGKFLPICGKRKAHLLGLNLHQDFHGTKHLRNRIRHP